ncbi:sensor histidine kinase [Actinomycetes bacterium NPDC127524]
MDTKWKNRTLVITWLLLLALGINGVVSAVSYGSKYIGKSYFQSIDFSSEYEQFTSLLAAFEITEHDKDALIREIKVTPDEIQEHRYRYGSLTQQITNIKNQYESKIADAKAAKNKEAANLYTAERNQKIDDITRNFKSDKYVENKIIEQKKQTIIDYFRKLGDYRSDYNQIKAVFSYYLKDMETGKTYTNLNISSDDKPESYFSSKDMLFVKSYPSSAGGQYFPVEKGYFDAPDSITELPKHYLKGKIGIVKTAPEDTSVMANYQSYKKTQIWYTALLAGGMASLLICLFFYKKTGVMNGISFKSQEVYYNRIPIDIRLLLLALSGFCTFMFFLEESIYIYEPDDSLSIVKRVLLQTLISAIPLTILLLQAVFWKRRDSRIIMEQEYQQSLIYKVFTNTANTFLYRNTGIQLFIMLAIVFFAGAGFAGVIAVNHLIVIYIPLLLLVAFPALFFLIKKVSYLNIIAQYAGRVADGFNEPDLAVKESSVLGQLAAHINTFKHGVKASRKEQAKSERLKTELITNVSHDLRTPLTSIITYAELLKKEETSGEKRREYIEIIDRKSKRLKLLIDDLFEASKMASGSIELVKEKADIVQLLQQSLAEYDEAIQKSSLTVRVTCPEKPVYALVDGQKLWRVFDNLIGNIMKYSLENTRVYISLNETNGRAVIVFKNVTKYELGDNVDEMFERFKRGDTSRHTEGSGLGLAIAKSIMDLHDGSMDIEVDGDLFKVSIVIESI